MGTFFSIIGTLVSAGFQAYGISQQKKAQRAAESREDKMLEEQTGESTRRFDVSAGMQRRQQRFTEKEAEKKWKWMEEEKNFTRGTQFANRFVGMLSQEPMLRNQLMNVWGKK